MPARPQIRAMNENVEIPEFAGRKLSIGPNGKCGAFQRQRFDLKILECGKYLE